MKSTTETVRAFYEADARQEWERLERHPYEYAINMRMMRRYIRPGDRVLDIGGGPGRYALALAELGCQVTLVDLSEANVEFARQKVQEAGLPLTAMQGNALEISRLVDGSFDHVLLMGPLYHLLEREEREQAVRQALSVLRDGGILYAAFISEYANMIYLLRDDPQMVDRQVPMVDAWFETFLHGQPYAGDAFTQAYFEKVSNVLPFFAQFPLKKLHFLSSEGMLQPFQNILAEQPQEVQKGWLEFAYQLCEREDLLPYGEHLLYIGQKQSC